MSKDKPRPDLLCENCQRSESTTLLYYEKYHKETGRISLVNPSFICDTCKPLFLAVNQFFENKPCLMGFEKLRKGLITGLTSKKEYEFSCFRNPYFKKKLWRIKHIWKNGRQDNPA